jgi:hypothetical protein
LPEYDGESCGNGFGGEGRAVGKLAVVGVSRADLAAAASLALFAKSIYVPNLPSILCHAFHCCSEVKRLYLMLLRNSTSIICTSRTGIAETSAHVLFV